MSQQQRQPVTLPSGKVLTIGGQAVLKNLKVRRLLPAGHYWLSEVQFCPKCLSFRVPHPDGTLTIVPIENIHWDEVEMNNVPQQELPALYRPLPVDFTFIELDMSDSDSSSDSESDPWDGFVDHPILTGRQFADAWLRHHLGHDYDGELEDIDIMN